MQKKYSTLTKWLFFIAYSIFCYFYLLKIVQPELHFHFQQPPFLYDKFFFQLYVIYPGGIAEYIGTYLMQFFFFKGIGALVILAMAWLIAIPVLKISQSFNQKEYSYLWMMIPFVIFISLFNNYHFPFAVAVKIVLVFCAAWFFLCFSKNLAKSVISFLIISLLVYYLAGSGSLILFSVSALILVFYHQKPLNGALFLLFDGLLSYAVLIIGYKYIFGISSVHKYFTIIPDMENYMEYKPGLLYNIFCFSLPGIAFILLVVSKLKPLFNKEKKEKESSSIFANPWFPVSVTGVVVLAGSIVAFTNTTDTHKKNLIACDYYCYNQQWAKTVKIAESDHVYDYLTNLNFNRAIDRMGYFADSLFCYPQYTGKASLFPDQIYLGETILAASDYYYDLGYISEARHWAYDMLVYLPYSPRALQRATITHLIFSEFPQAKKCLNILNKGMVSKDFVKKYMPMVNDSSLIAKDAELMAKRKLIPKDQEVSTAVTKRFVDLLEVNRNNKEAFEHLLMYFLMNEQFDVFMEKMVLAPLYYPDHLPEIFEEGTLIYSSAARTPIPEWIKIRPETMARFKDFTKTMNQYRNDNAKAKSELGKKYSDTFMYYLRFNSPKTTKSVIRERKEDDPVN